MSIMYGLDGFFMVALIQDRVQIGDIYHVEGVQPHEGIDYGGRLARVA
jgi:hypothetical protein